MAFYEQEAASTCIVLLHEALGSVKSWGSFPLALAKTTGLNVLLYSRRGHGWSQGPVRPRTPTLFQSEADLFLPALLRLFNVTSFLLYGHSEGAAFALTYASTQHPPCGLILECPYLVKQSFAGTRLERLGLNYQGGALQRLLARHHKNPDEVFYSWVNWASTLDAAIPSLCFSTRPMSIPTLVLQGGNDSLGSHSHLEVLGRLVASYDHRNLPTAGHFLHREQSDIVLLHIKEFLRHNRLAS